jgi:hypothetical protein
MLLFRGAMAGDRVGIFGVLDYALFFFMMTASMLIGIYFGFFAKNRPNSKEEYISGNKNMAFFPILMSLVARYVPFMHCYQPTKLLVNPYNEYYSVLNYI